MVLTQARRLTLQKVPWGEERLLPRQNDPKEMRGKVNKTEESSLENQKMQVSTKKKFKISVVPPLGKNYFLVSDTETEDHKCLSTTSAAPMIESVPLTFN